MISDYFSLINLKIIIFNKIFLKVKNKKNILKFLFQLNSEHSLFTKII